ncbi:MAG: hypothetical protein EHM72_09355, partial [Calditrichaeota bacterium]
MSFLSLRFMTAVWALLILWTNCTGKYMSKNSGDLVKIHDLNTIQIKMTPRFAMATLDEFKIVPDLAIQSLGSADSSLFLRTDPLILTQTYKLSFKNHLFPISKDDLLDRLTSDKVLGCTTSPDSTIFRIFSPRALGITLCLFENAETDQCDQFELRRDQNGVWEAALPGHYFGKYYAYRIFGPIGDGEMFDPDKLIADPYSQAVATENTYLHQAKTLILEPSTFDWEGDDWIRRPLDDLIIYECHIRDLTAHPSAGASAEIAGSYSGFLQSGIRGGLEYLKKLGVNAVEFLPLQDFGNIEIPFGEPVGDVTNTWNPYARNHWGYMTSYFFAPESYYATGQTLSPDKISGADGRQVNEFKQVVKALHREGIAVIMDVVYNHVSQYDQNCFKLLDKFYYFRLNPDNTFCAASGCGNDLKTERAMVRRLIIDSVKFWMQEYHIDGFRFDLAAMIDWETCDAILREARALNPQAIIIAEPWGGGGYAPAEFSQHGWASWNDQIRNGVKGQNPFNGHGFIFAKWQGQNSINTMQNYLSGTLAKNGGLFVKREHSVNYLESHDDHTMGDFIRIGLGNSEFVNDVDANAVLTDQQLRLNKLAALFLFVSQGAVMIHEGQEWARSKVIARTTVADDRV